MEKELNQKEWEEMAKFIAGEMEEQEKSEFEKKINSDEKTGTIANQLKSDWNEMEKHKGIHKYDTDKAWDKLFGKLQYEGLVNDIKQEPVERSYRLFFRIAAIFILGVLFASVVFYIIDGSGKTSWNVAETYKNADIKQIKLPDGSLVMLNSGSKLYYPDNFSEKERIVEFEGDAYFEIEKNHDKPFIIKAREAEIKVLGTSFNVNTNLENNDIEVLVTTGKVQLFTVQNPSVSVYLEPGYIGKLSKNKLSSQVNIDINYLSWKTKYFNFTEGIKLGEAIKILNRAYHVQIICKDKTVCEKVLNSTFDNDSLDKIIELICTTYALKVEKVNGEIHLYN